MYCAREGIRSKFTLSMIVLRFRAKEQVGFHGVEFLAQPTSGCEFSVRVFFLSPRTGCFSNAKGESLTYVWEGYAFPKAFGRKGKVSSLEQKLKD